MKLITIYSKHVLGVFLCFVLLFMSSCQKQETFAPEQEAALSGSGASGMNLDSDHFGTPPQIALPATISIGGNVTRLAAVAADNNAKPIAWGRAYVPEFQDFAIILLFEERIPNSVKIFCNPALEFATRYAKGRLICLKLYDYEKICKVYRIIAYPEWAFTNVPYLLRSRIPTFLEITHLVSGGGA